MTHLNLGKIENEDSLVTIKKELEDELPMELATAESSEQAIISENWLTRKPQESASLITLISTLIVILGSLVYWDNFFDLASLMPASHESIFVNHEYWRAWTTLFVHADQKHLLGNLFLFYIFGYFLSGYFSLSVFPVAAISMGGLTNLIVVWGMPSVSTLIGISGVVFWMGGAWLILYFLIDHRKTVLQRLIRSVGVALVLFMPSETFDPSISYKTHLIGFALGILFGFLYYIFNFKLFRSAEVHRTVT
jgi:rhomboid protease GluP